MNTRLIPMLVLLCLVPLPAFALEAQLDRTDYFRNQTVTITGSVVQSNDTSQIMEIWILQKNVWYDRATVPITSENFTKTLSITDAWQNDGLYTAKIIYNGEEMKIPFTVAQVPTPEEIFIEEILVEIEKEMNPIPEAEPIIEPIIDPIITPIVEEPIIEPIIDEPIITPIETGIPGWVKIIFVFWTNGQVTDDELMDAIKFLVNKGILVL